MSEHTAEKDVPDFIGFPVAWDSIRATDDAMLSGADLCGCPVPHLGAQLSGSPIRCERCRKLAWTIETRIIRQLRDRLVEVWNIADMRVGFDASHHFGVAILSALTRPLPPAKTERGQS